MEASPTAFAISRTDGGIAARAQGRCDEVEDLALALGVVLGHWRLLVHLHHTERTFDVNRHRISRSGRAVVALIDSRSPAAEWAAGFDVRTMVARASRAGRENRQSTQQGRRNAADRPQAPVGLAAFLPVASRAPLYGRLFWELIRDERTPTGRKAMLGGAPWGTSLSGGTSSRTICRSLGGLDDLVVVVLAVDLFLDGVPEDRPRGEAGRSGDRSTGPSTRTSPGSGGSRRRRSGGIVRRAPGADLVRRR